VDGINHGAGACAMRVHLEKEELGPVTADTMVPLGDREARPLSSFS
jgi:hypothetical protein